MLIYLQLIDDDEGKSKFEQLYDRYKGLMYHIASKMLNNKEDREDAMQSAFEALAKNINKIKEIECPQTYSYIVNIIESKAIDIQRTYKKRGEEIDIDESPVGIELPPLGDNGLADALARLPPRYREVLLLRYYAGYTTREISKMLELERGTVQKVIWRARATLQKALLEEGLNHEKLSR